MKKKSYVFKNWYYSKFNELINERVGRDNINPDMISAMRIKDRLMALDILEFKRIKEELKEALKQEKKEWTKKFKGAKK